MRKRVYKRRAPAGAAGGGRKKRRFIKRRRFGPPKNIPRGVSVLSNIPKLTHHRYVQFITLDPTAGSLAQIPFCCNNPNKPDYAHALGVSGSHQPQMFDQMGIFWKNFCVVGAKINVKTIGQAVSAQSTSLAWGIIVSPSPTISVDYKNLLEDGFSKVKLSNMSATSNNMTQLTKTFSLKKYYNLSSVRDQFDRFGAVYDNSGAAAPYEQAFFCVWASALETSLDGISQNYLVTLDYSILWQEPNLVAPS